MTPRRPRRWSWAVLRAVALGLGFVAMAAMVAWPESYLGTDAVLVGPTVLYYGPPGTDFPRTYSCRVCGESFDSDEPTEQRTSHHHRDSSFGLILGDLLE